MECINEYYVCNDVINYTECMNDDFLKNGICVYEVIRIINGIPLFFQDHLKRLENSLLLSGINYKLDYNNLYSNFSKLISANKIDNQNVKIVFNFSKEKLNYPIIYIYSIKHHYPSEYDYKHGVKTILYKGERDNPNAKVLNYFFREIVNKKIQEAEAYEAILVDTKGNITEGSKSNIFFIKGKTVYTAPLIDVLPGVTRGKIIEICNYYKIDVEQVNVKETEIEDMDGLFITGTSPKVLPICTVENMQFNSAKNIVIQNISRGYEEFMENYMNEKNIRSFNIN